MPDTLDVNMSHNGVPMFEEFLVKHEVKNEWTSIIYAVLPTLSKILSQESENISQNIGKNPWPYNFFNERGFFNTFLGTGRLQFWQTCRKLFAQSTKTVENW